MFNFFKPKPENQDPTNPSRREFLEKTAQVSLGAGLMLSGLEAEAATNKEKITLPTLEANREIDNKSLFGDPKKMEASYKQFLYEKKGDFSYYEPKLKGDASPYFRERKSKPHTLKEGVPIRPEQGEDVKIIPRDMAFLGEVAGGVAYGVLKKGTRVITVKDGSEVTHIADCANPVRIGGLVKCESLPENTKK